MTTETLRAAGPSELLDEILETIGESPASDLVDFTGADPVLPMPIRVGEAGGAAIAASGVEAARLYEHRNGVAQRVAVDIEAAAVGMRSSRYVRIEPPIESERFGTGRAGFFQAADGRWVFFRGVFPHHFARQLEVLRCEPTLEGVTAAVATWNSYELEEAIAANGAIGAVARTHEEWNAHPQGIAVASLPLFELIQIGEAPPLPLAPAARALDGIRVLDVTRVLAGPTCGRTLAEHGADVLRIGTDSPPDSPGFIYDTSHGKRHAALDLKSAAGLEALRELARSADVFSQGYRPGVMSGFGFSPEGFASLRPGIVYVTESAFSHLGPWSTRRGFDSLVEAASGVAIELADRATGKPQLAPCTPLDYSTGYLAATAVMAALRRRATEGGSWLVRCSLAQTENWMTHLTRADPDAIAARPDDLTDAQIEELSIRCPTPWGEMRFLAPIAHLSVTPGRWDLPSTPLGHDRAEWQTAS